MATRTQKLSFIALMAALANILSVPPIAVLVAPQLTVHFTQLPILVAAVLLGPLGGLLTGAVGALYMGLFVARIPFILGGLAILGLAAGFFTRRMRPVFAGVLAWVVQAPYVAVTDYVWFYIFMQRTPAEAWAIIIPIMVTLTVENVISSALAEVIVRYLRRTRIAPQIFNRQKE
jgi:riboflavin transporter FmnP